MKKLFTFTLAVLMGLALTSVAMASAEYTVDSAGYALVDGIINVATSELIAEGDTVNPGQTLYYMIYDDDGDMITDSDMVKSTTLKQSWDMGKSYIKSVSIVKKKYVDTANSISTYAYFVAIAYQATNSTSIDDISGEITLKKTSTSGTYGVPFTATLYINNPFSYDEADDFEITDEIMLFNFSSTGLLGGGSAATGDQTFSIIGDHYFDVDVTGQGKLLLYADTDYNSTVAAKYPEANLDFLNMNGASFNKIGELTILAEEGSYLYAQNSDGSLSAVKAEYDEYEEAFKIKTRTLGSFVISDAELDLIEEEEEIAVIVEEPEEEQAPVLVKPNPGTGVAL
jgi:hypothetical protein